jgi:hypothetical protein
MVHPRPLKARSILLPRRNLPADVPRLPLRLSRPLRAAAPLGSKRNAAPRHKPAVHPRRCSLRHARSRDVGWQRAVLQLRLLRQHRATAGGAGGERVEEVTRSVFLFFFCFNTSQKSTMDMMAAYSRVSEARGPGVHGHADSTLEI